MKIKKKMRFFGACHQFLHFDLDDQIQFGDGVRSFPSEEKDAMNLSLNVLDVLVKRMQHYLNWDCEMNLKNGHYCDGYCCCCCC